MSRQITASVPLETQPDGQKKPLIGSGLFALWRAAILCEGGEENVKELIRTLRPHQDLEILRQELVYQESRHDQSPEVWQARVDFVNDLASQRLSKAEIQALRISMILSDHPPPRSS